MVEAGTLEGRVGAGKGTRAALTFFAGDPDDPDDPDEGDDVEETAT